MIRYLLIGLFCLFFYDLRAQSIRVLDKSTHEPVEGVLVYSSDRKSYLTTDAEGRFDAEVFKNDSLLFLQHPSYQPLIITWEEIIKRGYKISLSEKIIRIGEVVISASKWEQSKLETPYEILTINPTDILVANPQTSADLLAASGQVFVQKSQLGGGSPMMRGFGANAVLIVVDGIRMNNAIFRGGNLHNVISIDPNALESSEVIFGPGSVIYGSDALGGVMSFQTKIPRFSMDDELIINGHAFARYSSANNEITGHALINLGKRRFSWLGSLSVSDFGHLKTGAVRPSKYSDFGTRPHYVRRINGRDTVMTNNNENLQIYSAYKQLSTLQKFRFRIKEHTHLNYSFMYSTTTDIPRYDRLTEYERDTLKYAQWYYGPQKWMMNALNLHLFRSNKAFDEAKITVAHQWFEESRHDRKYREALLRNRTENVSVLSLNADFEKALKSHSRLFYGMEYTYNHVKSGAFGEDIENRTILGIPTRYPDGGSDVNAIAVYASYKHDFRDNLFFNAGLRYGGQWLMSRFNTPVFGYDFIDNRSSALTGNIGLVARPTDHWKISGLFSTGYRAPNVDDISKVFDSEPGNVIVPNPGLKPEYSYNAEFSVTRFVNDHIEAGGVIFYSLLRDAMVRDDFTVNGRDSILYDGEMSKVRAWVNTGSADVYGFDLWFKVEFSSWWYGSMNLNYTDGKDLVNNEPLRHTTPLFGRASVIYDRKNFRGEFFVLFNGKRTLDDMPSSERNKAYLYTIDGSPGWYTLNLRFQYRFDEIFTFNGGVENLLDHHYRPYSSGISAPGRNLFISLRANF